MCSGPPAIMTHRQTHRPSPGRQAKRAHAKWHGLKPLQFEGYENRETPVKGLRRTASGAPGFDFPITVMGHSPRIG